MFCNHRWHTVSEVFNPPITTHVKANNLSEDMIRELVYGITTIRQECRNCNEVKIAYGPGNVAVKELSVDAIK